MSARPAISIIMPVFNGNGLLDRAIQSVRRQSFVDWELLVVDDGSTDDSAIRLWEIAGSDSRIRVFRHPTNHGISAARNTAIDHAQASLVAYLDHDDEFYPDHLARVWEWRDKGEVLVFRYDLIDDQPNSPDFGVIKRYDPAAHHDRMFTETISTVLGVVHRRDLFTRVGKFNEAIGGRFGGDEDSDLWRRFASVGASFTFVPAESGRYHVRDDSVSRIRSRSKSTDKHPSTVSEVVIRIGDKSYPVKIPTGDSWLANDVFEKHEYGSVPPSCLRPRPVVLDVGANVGLFALYSLLIYDPTATVHSFEPYRPNYDLLCENVKSFSGVISYAHGLGQSDTEAELYLHPSNSGANSVRPGYVPHPVGKAKVLLRNAATVWDELKLGEVDILKIDTAGSEVEILETLGQRARLARAILIKFHSAADRRRIDALLPDHQLFGANIRDNNRGVVKYVRSDLLNSVPASSMIPAVHPTAPIEPMKRDAAANAFPERGKLMMPRRAGPPRVLFASYHCHFDPSSGAAICTRDLFDLLTMRGWECQVVTGPQLDNPAATPIGTVLKDFPPNRRISGHTGQLSFTVFTQSDDGYPVSVFVPEPPAVHRPPGPDETRAFHDVVGRLAEDFQPDLVLTYGGDPASRAALVTAQKHQAAAVFWLHNRDYTDAGMFKAFDAVVVPSNSSRDHYSNLLGLDPVVLPGPWSWDRFLCNRITPSYVTFVNPEPAKGVFWFARIAEVIGRTRPDILFLLVQGRGQGNWLDRCGVNLAGINSIRLMPNTPDPRRFYQMSRIVLMPSLVAEGISRVAVEAMANGIPVIGSGRGGLAEALRTGGVLAEIPPQYTPSSRTPPSANEVSEWTEAIIRLWDNMTEYQHLSKSAKAAAEHSWHPSVLMPEWEQFLSAIISEKATCRN